MNEPKISIIIPVYNANETIAKALVSAIAQTYRNKEIIIVDDGSVQNCLDVLQEFSDQFLYHKQVNRGAAAARNTGVKLSSGEYIAFLDADDSWHPQKLELQLQTRALGFDFDICYCNSISAEQAHQEPMALDIGNIKPMNTDDIYANPFFGLPNVIIKKSTFDEILGFDEAKITAEDIDLYLKADKAGKLIINLQLNLMFRLMREDSLSSQTRSYTDLAEVISYHAKDSRASKAIVNRVLRKNYRQMAKYCLWQNDLKGFRYALGKLLSLQAYSDALALSAKLPFTLLKKALNR